MLLTSSTEQEMSFTVKAVGVMASVVELTMKPAGKLSSAAGLVCCTALLLYQSARLPASYLLAALAFSTPKGVLTKPSSVWLLKAVSLKFQTCIQQASAALRLQQARQVAAQTRLLYRGVVGVVDGQVVGRQDV